MNAEYAMLLLHVYKCEMGMRMDEVVDEEMQLMIDEDYGSSFLVVPLLSIRASFRLWSP